MSHDSARVAVLASTGSAGAGLVRFLIEVPPRGRHAGVTGDGGALWFVLAGSGSLMLNGTPGPAIVPDRGLWIPAGCAYQLQCDGAGWLRLDMVVLPGPKPGPASASSGLADGDSGVPLARDLRKCQAERTGDRTFRVLFGPGRDCAAATQFVGDIPPGRAPEHSHPYDEVVLVLRGTGIAHVGSVDRTLRAGTCLHLPPGRPHCLENTGSEPMRVLGVFHPAGSPAAKLAPVAD